MTQGQLVFRYAAFAVLATLVNLAVQRAVLFQSDGLAVLTLAMALGTLAGLLVKYLLDKTWIFEDRSSGMSTHARKFSLYTVMGIATTLVFWSVETTFWLVWKTEIMRELGAIVGLAIGYAVKYRLDARFVFVGGEGAER